MAFLEAYRGTDLATLFPAPQHNAAFPGPSDGAAFEAAYDDLVETLALHTIAQSAQASADLAGVAVATFDHLRRTERVGPDQRLNCERAVRLFHRWENRIWSGS